MHAVRGAIDRRDLPKARDLLARGGDHIDASVSQGLTQDLDRVQAEGEAGQIARGVLDAQPAGAPDKAAAVADAEARAGSDPMRRQLFGQAAAAEFHRRDQAAQAQRRGAVDALIAQLESPDVHGLADIPPAVMASAPPETRQAAADFFAAGGHPATSEPSARAQLSALAAHDPSAFADLDATQWATRLDRDDYGRLLADVKAMRAGGPPAQALQQLHAQIGATAGQLIADTPALSADPAAADRFQAALQRRAELAQSANPAKPLSDDDIARMGDGLLISGAWQVGADLKNALPPVTADTPHDRSVSDSEADGAFGAAPRLADDPRFTQAGLSSAAKGAAKFLGLTGKHAEDLYDAYQAGEVSADMAEALASTKWPPDTAAAKFEPKKAEVVFASDVSNPADTNKPTLSAQVVDDKGKSLGTVWVHDDGFTFQGNDGESHNFKAPLPQLWNEPSGLIHQREMAYIHRVEKVGPAVAKLFNFLMAEPLEFGAGVANDFGQQVLGDRGEGAERQVADINSPRNDVEAWAVEAAFEAREAQLQLRAAGQKPRIVRRGRVW